MAESHDGTTDDEPTTNASNPTFSGRRLPIDDAHELAHIERVARERQATLDVWVTAGTSGARIAVDTWEPNRHARGSITGHLATKIAHADAWGLSTVLDPVVDDDTGRATTDLTVVHIEEEDR